MKTIHSLLLAVLLLGFTGSPAPAAVQVSVDFFHENLEAYGDWREVGDYGYCWQPRDVDRDWRPYSDGRWIYTDAGWTWDSDEPYSWAVYHYGRWARVNRVGWVWVPDTEWAPAWVSWRRSPRYVGWAPLPPEARFSRSAGFSARVDVDYDIGPTNYRFIEVRNFGAPRLRTVFIEPQENITIIRQTTNITQINYVNNVVYNGGPQYEAISRESAQPVRRLKLDRRVDFEGDPRSLRAEQLQTRVEGDSLRVLAPTFDTKPATAPRKVAARIEKADVDRGWKDAGPAAEVEKVRTKMKSEPAAPAELAQPKSENVVEGTTPAAKPEDKSTTGKMREGVEPTATSPSEPVNAPPSKKGKTATADEPGNPDQPTKGKKATVPNAEPPAPQPGPANETPDNTKKGQKKKADVQQPPPEHMVPEQAPIQKPKKEAVSPGRELAPTTESDAPTAKSKGGKKKGGEAPPPSVVAPTQQLPKERQKGKQEQPPTQLPREVQAPEPKNHGKKEKQPQTEQPVPSAGKHNSPSAPESRPPEKKAEHHAQPPAPAPANNPPPQAPPEKGKGKEKGGKKDQDKKE